MKALLIITGLVISLITNSCATSQMKVGDVRDARDASSSQQNKKSNLEHNTNTPDVWMRLGEFMNYNLFDDSFDIVSGYKAFYDELSVSQQTELRGYLKRLVKGDLSEDELFEAWEENGAQIKFFPVKPMLQSFYNCSIDAQKC